MLYCRILFLAFEDSLLEYIIFFECDLFMQSRNLPTLWIHFRFKIKLLCLHDKKHFPRCHNHHICFKACFGLFLMEDFQAFLSLVMSLLTHFPFFQITSDYPISCFSWSSSGETAANLEVLHLLDQALSSILQDVQNIAIFYPVKIPSCSSILVES